MPSSEEEMGEILIADSIFLDRFFSVMRPGVCLELVACWATPGAPMAPSHHRGRKDWPVEEALGRTNNWER